jgi:nitrate/TMAO reductase-like tetraheme cytochrome c subunit
MVLKKKNGSGKILAHPFLTSIEKMIMVHFIILWVQFDQKKTTIKLVSQESFSFSIMAD